MVTRPHRPNGARTLPHVPTVSASSQEGSSTVDAATHKTTTIPRQFNRWPPTANSGMVGTVNFLTSATVRTHTTLTSTCVLNSTETVQRSTNRAVSSKIPTTATSVREWVEGAGALRKRMTVKCRLCKPHTLSTCLRGGCLLRQTRICGRRK
jgi:hypothetical protein